MAKIVTLKNLEGEKIYPRTLARCVQGLAHDSDITVYTGQDSPPSWDPEEFDGIQPGCFYCADSDDSAYIATSVSDSFVTWSKITNEYGSKTFFLYEPEYLDNPPTYIGEFDGINVGDLLVCMDTGPYPDSIAKINMYLCASIARYTITWKQIELSNNRIGVSEYTVIHETAKIDVRNYSDILILNWKNPEWTNPSFQIRCYKNGVWVDSIYVPDVSPSNPETVDISDFDELSFFVGYSSGSYSVHYKLINSVVHKREFKNEVKNKQDRYEEWELIHFDRLSEASAIAVNDVVLNNEYEKIKIEICGGCSAANINLNVYRNTASNPTSIFGNVTRQAETLYEITIENELKFHKNGYPCPTNAKYAAYSGTLQTAINTGSAPQTHGVQSYNTLKVALASGTFNANTYVLVYGVKKKNDIDILLNPTDFTLSSADTKDIYCVAALNSDGSTNTTYQWQMSNDGGTTWTNSTATGNATWKLSVSYGSGTERLYRCKITDKNGTVAYSKVAKCSISS